MPYRKTLFSRIPILEQHSKPVTYFVVLKSMAWNTNTQVRFTFTMCGSKMRTARCTHDLDTHVSNLVPRVFGLSGQQGWHCRTEQKARGLWVQDWHMSISFPDSLCCFVQGKGQWGRWPKGSQPLGTILHKCLQLVLFVDHTALLCLSSDIFFGTMSKRKISSYFGSERGKTIDQEEEKTENEFTHKEESREESDAALSRSNGWMITSDYGTKITWYFVTFFFFSWATERHFIG